MRIYSPSGAWNVEPNGEVVILFDLQCIYSVHSGGIDRICSDPQLVAINQQGLETFASVFYFQL